MTYAGEHLITTIAERTMEYPFKVWGFGEGIALEALWETAQVTGGNQYQRFVIDLFEQWLMRPIKESDHSVPGMLLLLAYEATDDNRFLERAADLASYMLKLPRDKETGALFHRPQHKDYCNFLYVDCMEVDAPFLCKLAAVTSETGYYDAGVDQLLSYCRLLQDDETGLFYHQYNGTNRIQNGAFWGRGNGWALLGILKTLMLLPETHHAFGRIQERLIRLCNALKVCQSDDGTWHTVLNHPNTYREASLPAMFGYGFQVGIQTKLLNQSYERVVGKAWQTMVKSIENGLLKGVSIATPPGDSNHYNTISTGAGFPWGQGPALLFALQYAKQHH